MTLESEYLHGRQGAEPLELIMSLDLLDSANVGFKHPDATLTLSRDLWLANGRPFLLLLPIAQYDAADHDAAMLAVHYGKPAVADRKEQ